MYAFWKRLSAAPIWLVESAEVRMFAPFIIMPPEPCEKVFLPVMVWPVVSVTPLMRDASSTFCAVVS